ncbi:MAG: hypothetical protein ACI8WM_002218 [Burkholderiaceae bacterium]|jgi:hypothetical protein
MIERVSALQEFGLIDAAPAVLTARVTLVAEMSTSGHCINPSFPCRRQ